MKEQVKHPEHYNKGIEVIKFIQSWKLNFSRGSAIKYICRGGIKDPETEIQDLRKAIEYLEFEIADIYKDTPVKDELVEELLKSRGLI